MTTNKQIIILSLIWLLELSIKLGNPDVVLLGKGKIAGELFFWTGPILILGIFTARFFKH